MQILLCNNSNFALEQQTPVIVDSLTWSGGLLVSVTQRQWVEVRLIWTESQVTLTETSSVEVRGIGQHSAF